VEVRPDGLVRLDPEPRRETWGLIESVRDSGLTIVLVTHLMEEAERLCDRVALIDQGRVVALGEPSHLAEQAATATRVRLRAPGRGMLQRGGRRRTSSSSSPSASISASTP
jgi:ABC-type multidrug transport system ATPase subunit